MNNLAQSEVFSLTLVIGTYLASLALYRKTRISLLHPLITSIFVIIVVLKTMDIEYESFQKGSHLIHFLLGPSVVALGYVLYEQIQYLKGNVISILTSVFVGAIVGIVSVIAIGELMGADAALVATLEPKSVTTPIAMGIAEKSGGIPSLTAVIVVAVGIFGSIVGPFVMKVLGIESRIAKGLALGALFARGRYFRCDSDRCGGRSFERTCHRPDGDHDGYPRSGYQLYYLAFLTSRYPGLDPGSYLALIPPLHIKLICNLFPNKITEVYCYFKRKTLLLHPKSITR